MSQAFSCIGLIGKPNHSGANKTLCALYKYLTDQGLKVLVESKVADKLNMPGCEPVALANMGETCDLAIVVGGDGNMLGAARELSCHDVAVIGVNRGNLGFLTDLNPEYFEKPLGEVLSGTYKVEYRFLLETSIMRNGQRVNSSSAVNEVVLHADKIAHMIEFEAFIDEDFVFRQRADGLIVSTPTGSTAYSLSGGGPILNPNMEAINIVPMFPHTLSSRPLVVDSNSAVRLKVSPTNRAAMQISCDSHVTMNVMAGDEIVITKSPNRLKLIHPENYSYYKVLRSKLNWGSQLY